MGGGREGNDERRDRRRQGEKEMGREDVGSGDG